MGGVAPVPARARGGPCGHHLHVPHKLQQAAPTAPRGWPSHHRTIWPQIKAPLESIVLEAGDEILLQVGGRMGWLAPHCAGPWALSQIKDAATPKTHGRPQASPTFWSGGPAVRSAAAACQHVRFTGVVNEFDYPFEVKVGGRE